jgi:aryl-alcohol dehydrogenase-like predicted oxidoreductase
MPMVEYVVSWTLSRPAVASIIAGCRNQRQLDVLISGADRCFPADHFPKIDALFPPPRPAWGGQVLRWRDGTWKMEDFEMTT